MAGNEEMLTPAQTVDSYGVATPQTTVRQRKPVNSTVAQDNIKKMQMTGELPEIKKQLEKER